MNDVIIIGGGPAGSAMGCYLSKAGINNIILESANHPRPHVGESMVTASTRVFDELGFLEILEREGAVKKYGAAWHAPSNQGSVSIEFAEFPQEGVNQDYTYHVDRSKFDLWLLKHAESMGSKIYQGVHVTQVLFEDGFARGVRVKIADQSVDLHAKVIVDASGRGTLLGRQLGIKKKDPIFNQYAIHAWFENVHRGEGHEADFIHIYFLPIPRGWVWQIPITDQITSVGVVAEKDAFKASRQDLESFFYAQLKTNHNLERAMKDAVRINEFKTEGDYSYSMEKFVGDGFVLVGDAARFVDPIFSSGVSIALYSAKFASERIKHAFEVNDFSEAIFKPYEERVRKGVNIWYEFILLYYKLLPTFTYFIRSKKHRLQVLQLLQGEVYDRKDAPVLAEMRKFIEAVERTDNNIFKPKLNDIPLEILKEFVED